MRRRARTIKAAAIGQPYTIRRIRDDFLNQTCRGMVAEVMYVEVDPLAGTRRDMFSRKECVPIPPVAGQGRPAAVLPPEQVAVRDAVAKRLPQLQVGIDPHIRGLTGLKTYLWYQDGDTRRQAVDHDRDPTTAPREGIEVSAAAGPYAITARAWIVEYRWDMGDGQSYTATQPGSEQYPAAVHVYETKGDYLVTAEAVWVATYDWSAGGASGSGQLGTVVRRTSRDYRVHEVRSVLVG